MLLQPRMQKRGEKKRWHWGKAMITLQVNSSNKQLTNKPELVSVHNLITRWRTKVGRPLLLKGEEEKTRLVLAGQVAKRLPRGVV
jgi:hypothetical protein